MWTPFDVDTMQSALSRRYANDAILPVAHFRNVSRTEEAGYHCSEGPEVLDLIAGDGVRIARHVAAGK